MLRTLFSARSKREPVELVGDLHEPAGVDDVVRRVEHAALGASTSSSPGAASWLLAAPQTMRAVRVAATWASTASPSAQGA